MGNGIKEGEEEMVDAVDFSKGNITREQIRCRYPNCEKDGVIPFFEGNIIDLKKAIPYCFEHAAIVQNEKEDKRLEEKILKMREEGKI